MMSVLSFLIMLGLVGVGIYVFFFLLQIGIGLIIGLAVGVAALAQWVINQFKGGPK